MSLHPTIVFEVNLETQNNLDHLTPDRYQSSADQGRTEGSNHSSTRTTWFPGLTAAENRALKHGDQFTANGKKAIYLKNEYTTGANPVLKVISVT